MSLEKALLKRLQILYVEDDTNVRNELSTLLSNFFDHVYSAADGQEGYDTYMKYQDKIDLIISDINMPNLTGIEMLRKIREQDKKVSVIFATAYSDNQFLIDAIQLKVYDYIIKPIDVRGLIVSINELAQNIYNKHLIVEQNKELEKYKEITDTNNIVIKTDTSMKINYVNELFCQTTHYETNELIGKEFTSIKHNDTDVTIFKEMYSKVLDNQGWHGRIKNVKKDGTAYIVDMYMIPTYDDSGHIDGTMSILKDITEDVNKKRDVQVALMKDKSNIFIKSKDASAEYTTKINKLIEELDESHNAIKHVKTEKDKYVYAIEKYKIENQQLKNELIHYKKDSHIVEDKSTLTLKTNKENYDLKLDLKRLSIENEQLKEEVERQVTQAKVTLEIKIDDLEKELQEYKDKLDSIEDGHVLMQKIEYWKVKAKNESKRVEELERKIMQTGDKTIMQKFFGGKQ